MNGRLKIILVDLTPVLPGGTNGGAKIFVLELLRRLAIMAPETQFVLLTQAASHDELAALDRTNVRRHMVVGAAEVATIDRRLLRLVAQVVPHLPSAKIRRIVSRASYELISMFKRNHSLPLVRDQNADLLFCPFTAPTYFVPGIPTVCTIYDLQYKTYPDFFSADDVAQRDRTFKAACQRSTVLTAISDYSRDSAIAWGRLDPARIKTIHLRMARRAGDYVPSDEAILDRVGVTSQKYLVYSANFWKHKNHEMLFTAFGMVCHGGLSDDIKLVCTGAPDARQAWLKQAVRAMGLDGRILFPGFLPTGEFAALMANSRGVIFPSLYEGFGLPVVEAMAAGVPVACSNTTSLPEVAANAALLFNPKIPTEIAQAIESLVNDDDLRIRLVQTGKSRAVEFLDADRMVEEYWKLFQHTVADHEIGESHLTSIYEDGWAGPVLDLRVAPAISAQTLLIKLSVPKWVPQSTLRIQVTRDGEICGTPLDIKRGATATYSVLLDKGSGTYQIQLSPSFVPHYLGHGDDLRELSVVLQQCSIVRADGDHIDLFPVEVPA